MIYPLKDENYTELYGNTCSSKGGRAVNVYAMNSVRIMYVREENLSKSRNDTKGEEGLTNQAP